MPINQNDNVQRNKDIQEWVPWFWNPRMMLTIMLCPKICVSTPNACSMIRFKPLYKNLSLMIQASLASSPCLPSLFLFSWHFELHYFIFNQIGYLGFSFINKFTTFETHWIQILIIWQLIWLILKNWRNGFSLFFFGRLIIDTFLWGNSVTG